VKNIDIISFIYIYWILSIYNMLKSYLIIMFLYLCFEKIGFPFQSLVFEKYDFWGKFSRTQKWFKLFAICVEFLLRIFVFQRSNKNWFLWNLCDFMEFFRRQKLKFSIPISVGPGCLPIDWGRSRSTGPVDRCAQTCTQPRLGGRLTGLVDRQRASALWKWPWSTGRELCSLFPLSGRPVA